MPVKKRKPGRPPKAETAPAPITTTPTKARPARPHRPGLPIVRRGDEWSRCYDRTLASARRAWATGTLDEAAGALSSLFTIFMAAEDSNTVTPDELADMERALYRAVAAFPPERFRHA